jgi:hypothetical protein
MASLTRPKSSDPHRLAPDAPVATLPRTHGPLIPDQQAQSAFAHSLMQVAIFFYHLLLTTDMHCATF